MEIRLGKADQVVIEMKELREELKKMRTRVSDL